MRAASSDPLWVGLTLIRCTHWCRAAREEIPEIGLENSAIAGCPDDRPGSPGVQGPSLPRPVNAPRCTAPGGRCYVVGARLSASQT